MKYIDALNDISEQEHSLNYIKEEIYLDKYLKNHKHWNVALVKESILSIEEFHLICWYTVNLSSKINSYLHEKHQKDECMNLVISTLDSALSKLPSLNNSIVYRMEGFGMARDIDSFKPNIVVPAFLSTSLDNFRNTSIVWKIKTKQKESKAKLISMISNNGSEKEVLFERNSIFLMNNHRKMKHATYIYVEEI